MAVPEKIQLSEQIKNLCLRLDRSIDTKIEWEKQKLSSFAKSINNITPVSYTHLTLPTTSRV